MPDQEISASETLYLYRAFISYCREDNRGDGQCWGDWLQGLIQTFQIPAPYVGRQTRAGVLGTSIGDVFLDRIDLGVGDTLTDAIIEKLRKSRFLLVIGSPASAKSKWVGLEIEEFVKHHGRERVLLLAIEGKVEKDWVHPKYFECLQLEEVQIYVELRATRRQENGVTYQVRGWTDAAHYARHLKKGGIYKSAEIKRQVADYERDHRDAFFKLMGELTGLSPRDLNGEAAMDEIKRQRRALMKRTIVALAMFVLAGATILFYVRSERHRRSAERSLQMIGDAHESTSRMLSDVLVDLRAKLRETGSDGLLDEAERTVKQYFDENELAGDDDESVHMRSVVLNSRGYLARRAGDFAAAEKHYAEAGRLRGQLLAKHPANAMYDHNIAVSLDNEGDLFTARATALEGAGKDGGVYLSRALGLYRESLRISKKLAARTDATNHWRHDYAVSCFKVGDTLFRAGDIEPSLAVLGEGLEVAKALVAADPDYAKFQAHLALFQLDIGQIEATKDNEAAARTALNSAKGIFARLEKQGRLTKQYAEWRAKVDAVLADIAPEKP